MSLIDKEKYTSFIRDEDTKLFITQNLSKLEGVLRTFDIRYTDFMDPYRQKVFSSILNAFSDGVSYAAFGGIDSAERKLFAVYPYYEVEVDNPLSAVRFEGNFSFEKISHRDCLGALMSLGLVREKIGDIYLCEDYFDVISEQKLAHYIAANLNKIRHTGVKGKIIPVSEIRPASVDYIYKDVFASSMRVDVVISSAFNLSRKISSSLCENGRVKVDFEPVYSRTIQLVVGTLVSVRGYGRFKITALNGMTGKGKYRIKIGFYD